MQMADMVVDSRYQSSCRIDFLPQRIREAHRVLGNAFFTIGEIDIGKKVHERYTVLLSKAYRHQPIVQNCLVFANEGDVQGMVSQVSQ